MRNASSFNRSNNYGIFNIKFFGPKIWNPLDDSVKTLNLKRFKKQFKNQLIHQYELAISQSPASSRANPMLEGQEIWQHTFKLNV